MIGSGGGSNTHMSDSMVVPPIEAIWVIVVVGVIVSI